MSMVTQALSTTTLSVDAARQKELAQAREVGEGFESVFLHMILEPLEEVGESFFGGGTSGRTFGGLYRQQLSDQMAKATPLGIASLIEDAIVSKQDATPAAAGGAEGLLEARSLQSQMNQLQAQQSYEGASR